MPKQSEEEPVGGRDPLRMEKAGEVGKGQLEREWQEYLSPGLSPANKAKGNAVIILICISQTLEKL